MNLKGFETQLQLTIRGPILIHGAEVGAAGVDAVAMRTSDDRLLIPGDQIQGRVREALEDVGDDYEGWVRSQEFGSPRNDDEPPELSDAELADAAKLANLERAARRYPVFFSDFTSLGPHSPSRAETLTQVAMDADTGAAASGQLRLLDCPVAAGQPALFTGTVRFFCASAGHAQEQLNRILKAVRWSASCGSNRSVGFGRIVDACSLAQSIRRFDRTVDAAVGRADDQLLVDFSFLDPVCVPEGLANGNIYETRDDIPGEALRGAVAGLLCRIAGQDQPQHEFPDATKEDSFAYRDLCELFHRVRITTARPVKSGDRAGNPAVIPMSVAVAGRRVFDFALLNPQEEAGLFDGRSAAFSPDWKSAQWQGCGEHFNIVRPKKELRVHTAIQTADRRAADGRLFAVRSLRPDGLSWRATVSIDSRSGTDESRPTAKQCARALSQLCSLMSSGWLSVSRTRARCTARPIAVKPKRRSVTPLSYEGQSVFVVTLRGSTLMLPPWKCVDGTGVMKSVADIDELFAEYWREISNKSLRELPEKRFKTDRLIGGFQAWKYRFDPREDRGLNSEADIARRISQQKDLPFNPTLVVNPGSVFVLAVSDGKAEEAGRHVADWLAYGLPLPNWASTAYGDTHHTNVFLPQNGYGEIDVNLPCHSFNSYHKPLLELTE